MGSRSHTQTSATRNTDSALQQTQVQSRPFAIQAQAETAAIEQQELPDVQTQLETAKQFGHRFADVANSVSSETKARSSLPLIQPKLTIGAPGDKYEQEADRVAQQVVQQLNAPPAGQASSNQALQRESTPAEEEELQMRPEIFQLQREESAEVEEEDPDDALQMKSDSRLQREESAEVEEEDPDDALQMKPEISHLQRQEAAEAEDEELQMKPWLQRQENVGGGEASTDLEASIQQSRGSGQALNRDLQQRMGQAMGADFSGVRVHTDAKSDQLNKSIQAKAFTTQQDVFFRAGAYKPTSQDGQELIAHELTHVVQQCGSTVQRTSMSRLSLSAQPTPETVQRAFQPATTNSNAHLRNDGVWKPFVGGKINSGSEVVIDPNQQKTQTRRFLGDVSWTKAVNVTGANWDWNQRNATTYIRNSRVAPKIYPMPAPGVAAPNRTGLRPEKQWNEQAGEYVMLENSAAVPGAKLVKKAGAFRRLTAANQYEDLNDKETKQLDLTQLETSLKARLKTILQTAASDEHLQAGLLETDENAGKLMHPLRFAEAKSSTGDSFINWYNWVDGVFDRIEEGAEFAAQSLEHWRTWLHPLQADQVSIDEVKLTGSDLHDEGLGAIFVTFTKPIGPEGHKFADQTSFTVLIKSEDKALEKALFGTEASSLANKVNDMAELDPTESITTFKMETSANFGSIIECVRGAAADSFDRPQPCSSAMKEAMVFAFIAGLSDLHRENVLWRDGKPYFIDADNALNKDRLGLTSKPQAKNQSGFTKYSRDAAIEQMDVIEKTPEDSESKIMQALLADAEQEPLIEAVRVAFAGKTGRVVPIATGSWARALKQNYIFKPEGAVGDDNYSTRWGIATKQATQVPAGTPGTPEPGLEGEAGIAQSGLAFDTAEEIQQIKADLDQGKIPFYNYEYDTGYVIHNGHVVWHGQPLIEALEILLAKFPNQRGIT